VDEQLVREGRMLRLATRAEVEGLALEKKPAAAPRRARAVRAEVADLILT
jgi:hypothetical protein